MKIQKHHDLFDALIGGGFVKNDAELCRRVKISCPAISKMRHGHMPVSDVLRVAIMRQFGWSLKRLDEFAPPESAPK